MSRNEKTNKVNEVRLGKRDRYTMRYLTERIHAIIKKADDAAYVKAKENAKAALAASKKSAVRKVEELLRDVSRKRLEESVLRMVLSNRGDFSSLLTNQMLVDGKSLREQCEDLLAGEMPAEPGRCDSYVCYDGLEGHFYFFLPESRDKMQAALDTLYLAGDDEVKALLASLEKWTPKV